jgi:hypothetical protein
LSLLNYFDILQTRCSERKKTKVKNKTTGKQEPSQTHVGKYSEFDVRSMQRVAKVRFVKYLHPLGFKSVFASASICKKCRAKFSKIEKQERRERENIIKIKISLSNQ